MILSSNILENKFVYFLSKSKMRLRRLRPLSSLCWSQDVVGLA